MMHVKRILFSLGTCLILFMMGCKKDQLIKVGLKSEKELRTVTLRMDQFNQQINPLLASVDRGFIGSVKSQGNVIPHPDVQILYFWSFNQDKLVADIGLDTVHTSFFVEKNNGDSTYSFAAGTRYPPYIAGRAWSVAGPKVWSVSIPIHDIQRLETLRYDMMRSSTGPGAHLISYSLDNSDEYITLSNTQSIEQSWSSYSFTLSDIALQKDTEWIHLRWEFEEGDRSDSTNYNMSTGTIRLDNLSLLGQYLGSRTDPILLGEGQVNYHVFSSVDSSLVLQGHQLFHSNQGKEPIIEFKLEEGQYFVHIAANFSSDDLLFPEYMSEAGDFFVYHLLREKGGVSYGAIIPMLEIAGDVALTLEMERLYSQIRFEFMDSTGLDEVHHIEITSLLKSIFFPYHADFVPDTEWIDQIEVLDYFGDFSREPSVEFNHFLGVTAIPKDLNYMIKAYNIAGSLLREIEVNASILNNVQLVFRGNLLDSYVSPTQVHRLKWNEVWQEQKMIDF